MTSLPARRPIRVLIADDHGLLRAGLRSLLRSEADIDVIGEAADGVEALRLAAELRPDVVLADISMPEPNGIEVARRLRILVPGCMTLILTMYEDPQMLHDALAAGATGYLIKRAADYELAHAIRVTAAGQRYIHKAMRQYMTEPAPQPARSVPGHALNEDLSEREVQLLGLLAQAATTQKVADALGISAAEADQMRRELMARLGLRSRADVVAYVQQRGILPS